MTPANGDHSQPRRPAKAKPDIRPQVALPAMFNRLGAIPPPSRFLLPRDESPHPATIPKACIAI